MKNNATQIVKYFDKILPDVKCELNYSTNYQLLVAVILSAQCTDKRVNQVTEKLFDVAPTPTAMLMLGRENLELFIHSCGFFSNKAKSIIATSEILINKFDSTVPNNMIDLLTLSGVGRKTANVILAECFNESAFAVDTHVSRISKRLNIANESDNPNEIEKKLVKYFINQKHNILHHQMIHFGRYKCTSRKPNCSDCELKSICKYYKNLF